MASNLARRVGAAFVFVPTLSAVCWWGGVPLLVGTAFVVGVGTWEVLQFHRTKGGRPFIWAGVLMSLGVAAWFHWLGPRRVIDLFVVCALGTLVIALLRRRGGGSLLDVSSTLFGVAYVGFLGSTLLLVRNLPIPHAAPLTLTLLASIWIMDALAYFAGRAFGRRHPFPRVSPKKSVAGCVVGLLGALGTVRLAACWLEDVSWQDVLVIGSIVGIAGQIGDLAESLLKRDCGVKDSSDLIPGHGGAPDLFDSALFAVPLTYLYLVVRHGLWG